MSTSLRNRLNDLASSFAAGVLDAVRGSSLQELDAESTGPARRAAPARSGALTTAAPPSSEGAPRRRPGRLPRRSAGDISGVIDRVVELLRGHPGGLRAEQIRGALGLSPQELPRPLKEGLDSGRFAKSGQKRATTYFSKGAASKGAASKGAASKGAASKGTASGAKSAGRRTARARTAAAAAPSAARPKKAAKANGKIAPRPAPVPAPAEAEPVAAVASPTLEAPAE